MADNFNWQTESDDWDELSPVAVVQPPRRKRWLWLPVLLLLLLMIGGLTWWLQQDLEETEAMLEVEIRASRQIIDQAAAQQDGELLTSFISGRDLDWTAAQQQLLTEGFLFDYPTMGLNSAGPSVEPPQVTLGSALSAAELVATYDYTTQNADGVTMTIQFERTSIFRLGGDRWLWSPPPGDYWGLNQRSRGLHVVYNYPERDAAVIHRLSRDLDEMIADLCALPDMGCPFSVEVKLEFVTDPGVLIAINDWSNHLRSGRTIELPSPSLIGRPMSETAYQALFRGYAVLVAAPLIANLVQYECCQQVHLFSILLDRQLHELRLRPWPLTPADYEAMLREGMGIEDSESVWYRDDADAVIAWDGRRRLYALIDYILYLNPQTSIAEMERQLSIADSYAGWLRSFLDLPLTEMTVWQAFLSRQTPAAARPRPVALPEQPIVVSCTANSSEPGTLFNFRPTAALEERWDLIARVPNPATVEQMELLADGTVLLLERTGRISLIDDGQQVRLDRSPIRDNITYYPAAIAPGRTRFVARISDPVAAETRHELIDVDECLAAGCQPQPLAGPIVWSPDGQRSLVLSYPETPSGRNESLLFLGDAYGRPEGVGRPATSSTREMSPPFWLDNASFGFLQWQPGDQLLDLVIGDALQERELARIQIDELISGWPTEVSGFTDRIWPGKIQVNPAAVNQLIIPLTHFDRDQTLFFLLDWQANPFQVLPLQAGNFSDAFFSPDGRWLTIIQGSMGQPDNRELILVDMATGAPQSLGPIDFQGDGRELWSTDGQWLLYQTDGLIYLVAPANGYRQLMVGDAHGCRASFTPESVTVDRQVIE